jgi:hypothetical protein
MNITIDIPDMSSSHPIAYHDTVSFKFTANDKTFRFDKPNAFKEKVPPGPYKQGSSIGPFTPKLKNTTVNFYYDNSEMLGMHSVLIGN